MKWIWFIPVWLTIGTWGSRVAWKERLALGDLLPAGARLQLGQGGGVTIRIGLRHLNAMQLAEWSSMSAVKVSLI